MGPEKEGRGGWMGSFVGSVRSTRSLQHRDRVEEAGMPTNSPGGNGLSAWISPAQIRTGKNITPGGKHGGVSNHDGISSHSSSSSGEVVSPPIRPPSPRRRASSGSRFSEGLPQPKKPSIALQWIRKKVRGKSDTETGDHGSRRTRSPEEKQPALTARKSKKHLHTTTILPHESAESSKTSGNIQEYGARTPLPALNDPPPPARSLLSPVDSSLATTSSKGGRRSRVRHLSIDVDRLVTAATPTRRALSNTLSFESTTPPYRSQSAPPPNALWELEFLPSEATVVQTPREYPVYRPQRLGVQAMQPANEMKRFSLTDMAQPQPPLTPVGEHDTHLDLEEEQEVSSEPGISLIGHVTQADYDAIAPFVGQDRLCKEDNTPEFAGKKSAVYEGFRRASMQAKSVVHRKQTPAVQSITESDIPERTPSRLGAVFQWARRTPTPDVAVPTDATFSSRAIRHGLGASDAKPVKPVEVLIAEEKRRKRDSGVIGLCPIDDYAESTDSSLTYSSALREIAGLTKHPTGRKNRAQAGDRGTSSDVEEQATPISPNGPTKAVIPGDLLHNESNEGGV